MGGWGKLLKISSFYTICVCPEKVTLFAKLFFSATQNRDQETPKNPTAPLGSQPKTRTETPI